MNNQKNNSPPINNHRLTDLDLSPEDYASVAIALELASDKADVSDGEDYRLLAKLFRLMAITSIFREQMDDQALANAKKDLEALGLTDIFIGENYGAPV